MCVGMCVCVYVCVCVGGGLSPHHPIAGTSAVECSFLWSGLRLQAITHAHTHK